MRLGVGVAATVAALTLAAGAPATESTIYPGVGIGKVELGMTRAQVERVLGENAIVNGRETVAGTRYVELGWNFATWTVAFAGNGRTARGVQIDGAQPADVRPRRHPSRRSIRASA